VDSLSKTARNLLVGGPPRVFSLDYGGYRGTLAYKSAGKKTVFFCVAGGTGLVLGKPFPNPAGPEAAEVRIGYETDGIQGICKIYTLSGKQVRILSAGNSAENTAGPAIDPFSYNPRRIFIWNLKNSTGSRVEPGIYLYYLLTQSGAVAEQGKIACIGRTK
jgi:hypothetical protein